MMKFKCQDCDAVFTEAEAGSERDFVGYYGEQSAYQYWMFCPECGSDCIDDYYEEEDENGEVIGTETAMTARKVDLEDEGRTDT